MNFRLTCGLACLLFLLPLLGASQQHDESTTSAADGGAPGDQAQRVYLDPTTGRLTDNPPPGVEVLALSPEELNGLSTSHEGLVTAPVPGGGYAVDLQGRFRHMAVAMVAPDGTVTISEFNQASHRHLEATHSSADKNE